MNLLRTLAVTSGLSLLLTACPNETKPTPTPTEPTQTEPTTGDAAVIIPATTKVADASTRAALSAYDADTGLMRFSQQSAVLTNLRPGDVLVGEPSNAAPSGYLRKVTAMRQDGTDTVLDTTQANLTDAVSQGELNADFTLSGDDLLRTEDLPEGATLSVNPAQSDLLKPQAGVGENYGFSLKFNRTFVPVQGPNATGTIKVDGAVSFNVGYGVNVGIKACFELPPICVKSFEAKVGFDQRSNLNIKGDFQGVVGDAVKVGTQYFKPKVFFIGPVPVVLVPKIELYLTAGGEIRAKVDFAASQSATAQVGSRWTKASGWKDISGFNIGGQVSAPTFAGSLNPRVGLRTTASFTLYGVAGPEATLEGGVKLDVASPRNPNWIVGGFLKGTLGFRVKLPVLGTLASYSTTLFDTSKELARSANTPPTLTLSGTPLTAMQGQPINLRAGGCFGVFGTVYYTASDAEDGCGVSVSVVSDRDGPLPPDFTFKTLGVRTLTVTGRDSGGAMSSLTLRLDVINPPPVLTLQSTGDPRQGEDYSVSAQITDSNEPATTDLCANTRWAVDAPDTLSSATGCLVTIKFGKLGARQVRVSTQDSLGAAASQTLTLNVLPPPANPFPKIVSSGVYSREFVGDGAGTLRFCGSPAVPSGNTIDLRQEGCSFLISGPQPQPKRYFGGVVVENPSSEKLTYDWRLLYIGGSGSELEGPDSLGSSATSFDLRSPGDALVNTLTCRVTLKVNAPEPSRSKGPLTVWSGKCTALYGSAPR